MMVGRLVELVAWLRGQFRSESAGVAEDMFDAVIRVMYHAGRVEALEEAVTGVSVTGQGDVIDALTAALDTARRELIEAIRALDEYRYIEHEITAYLRNTSSRNNTELKVQQTVTS